MPALSTADGIDPIRAAHISARIDRLPAVATVWRLVALLSIGGFFELYDLFQTAYISPGFYPTKAEHGKVVPTWNYLAVHAYGKAQVFTDAERLLTVVSGLTERHENGRAQPWAVTDAPADYIGGMLKAIVGFALPIQRLEGKRKLSQNRSAADQAGVRDGLAASEDLHDQTLAHLIR